MDNYIRFRNEAKKINDELIKQEGRKNSNKYIKKIILDQLDNKDNWTEYGCLITCIYDNYEDDVDRFHDVLQSTCDYINSTTDFIKYDKNTWIESLDDNILNQRPTLKVKNYFGLDRETRDNFDKIWVRRYPDFLLKKEKVYKVIVALDYNYYGPIDETVLGSEKTNK